MTNYVDPTPEGFGAMMKLPDDGPIHMLNLIKLRKEARYEPGRGMTGAEAYKVYLKESGPIFTRVGGKIIWSANPRLVLIGPEDELWDIAFVAAYPSAAAFGEMVKDPDYQIAVKHRQAAVETSRLIRMKPAEFGAVFG